MNLTIKILGIVFLLGIGTTNAQTYFHPYGTANISNLQNKGELQIDISRLNLENLQGYVFDLNYATSNRYFISSSFNFCSGSEYQAYKEPYSGWFYSSPGQIEYNINTKQYVVDLKFGRGDFLRPLGSEVKSFYYNGSIGLIYGNYSSQETVSNYLNINKRVFGISSLLNLGFSSQYFGFFSFISLNQNYVLKNEGFVKRDLVNLNELYYVNDKYVKQYFSALYGFGLKFGIRAVKGHLVLGFNTPPMYDDPNIQAYGKVYFRYGLSLNLFNKKNKQLSVEDENTSPGIF